MLILGIDPGLTTAGIGLIDATNRHHPTAVDWLTITTNPALPLAERLRELRDDLDAYLKDVHPEKAVVEQLFFATNKQTAMATAQARGVILATLAGHGIAVQKVTPLQLKTAITGDGKSDKRQMQEMVKRILKLKELPSPADAADALALALYGAFTLHVSEPASPSRPRQTTRKLPR